MEQPFVTAVTHSDAEARVTLTGLRDEPGVAGRVFRRPRRRPRQRRRDHPERAGRGDQLADLSFTVDRADLATATDTIAALGKVSNGIRTDERIGKVSIVGAGMRSHPGVAAKVFEVLGEERINIEMISTSPIKISCVISADRVPTPSTPCTRRSSSAPTRSRRGPDRARSPADGRRLSAAVILARR
jgi:aspartate kinase